MTRRRLNHLNCDKTLQPFDPRELVIPGALDESKLHEGGRIKPVVVMVDQEEGKAYVVDGRHAARRAQLNGSENIMGVVVGETDMVGRQTAKERVEGMKRAKGRERE